MTAAFAHAPAPAPWGRDALPGAVAWRLGRVVEGAAKTQVEWLLKRNCSMAPRQLFNIYLSMCVVLLAIAFAFAWFGAAPVLAFAGLEMALVGVALLVYARHAADQEFITLAEGALTVVHRHGALTDKTTFRAAWVRVEPAAGDRSLVELTGDGLLARVGRYLRPDLRQPLAQELRAALRAHNHIFELKQRRQ